MTVALALAPDTAPSHEHYWVDAPDDETGWHCTICGLTEYQGDPGIGTSERYLLDALDRARAIASEYRPRSLPRGRGEAMSTEAILTAAEALRMSGFTEYRAKAMTPISDRTFPPGTIYQTPEGLRAEDEETRCAFDVQGGIYPIRESVFRASYELPAPIVDEPCPGCTWIIERGGGWACGICGTPHPITTALDRLEGKP